MSLTLICVCMMRRSSFGISGVAEDGLADTKAGSRVSSLDVLVDRLRKHATGEHPVATVFFFARKHRDRAGRERLMTVTEAGQKGAKKAVD